MADLIVNSLEIETEILAPIATNLANGLMSSTDKSKVDAVESGATANSTDAQLRDRSTHTGTQIASTISDFNTVASAAAPVQSVASKTGIVTLVKADVGLSSVDNTSDLNKPISTATQTALNLKYDSSNPSSYQTAVQVSSTVGSAITTHEAALDPHPQYETSTEAQAKVDAHANLTTNPHSVTKAQVGLGSVDNTADIDKPISTATQTALDLKANLSGGNTFSGDQVLNGSLSISSTTLGFLPPRMTSTQRLAIVGPVEGLLVFDTDLNTLCEYSGTSWKFEYRINATAIQTSTSTTYANITEFVSLSIEPGLYVLELKGIMQSTATTTGLGLRLVNGTAVLSTLAIAWYFGLAANGTNKTYEYHQITTADNITSTAVLAINTNTPVRGQGIFRVTTAGTVAIQLRTEIAASGVSIRPDSTLMIKKIG